MYLRARYIHKHILGISRIIMKNPPTWYIRNYYEALIVGHQSHTSIYMFIRYITQKIHKDVHATFKGVNVRKN